MQASAADVLRPTQMSSRRLQRELRAASRRLQWAMRAASQRRQHEMRAAFRRAGRKTIRDLLYRGWMTRADLPPGLADMIKPSSEERKAAIEWLQRKESSRDRVIYWCTVFGAITSTVAAIAACIAASPVLLGWVPK
jgi:hypothetical protein